MSGRVIVRIAVLAVLCLISVVGIWAAHSLGSAALGKVGGILIALVAALMLGAIVYIVDALVRGVSQKESDHEV